ncbi:MAG TPA: glycosyltransferase family 4 protein [Sphingomicrobium sp.]|nr:glycosyltransferase family 4 protein [Sphingomicrobium sp.]
MSTPTDLFSLDLATPAPRNRDSIALFSAYYPAQGGGIELVCGDLVSSLCRLGKKINWLALEGDTTGIHVDCAVTPLPGTNAIYSRSGIPFPLPKPRAMPRIWNAVRESSLVIVAEANFIVSCAAFIVAKFQKKPVLLIEHLGAPSTVSAWVAAMMRVAERFAVRPMLRSADALVYVSPAVAKHYSGLRTRRAAQIIGHGVDTELFSPAQSKEEKLGARAQLGLADGPPLACFVGRCTTSKGIEVFMRMAELRPDWNFVVAGMGPVDPTSCGLSNLKALGHVDRPTLSRLYKASDALVLPSRSESFSLVVREALAAGIRVLCGDQIIETDPALAPFLLVQPVDLDAREVTARLFAAALDDPARSSAAQARTYVVENCSWTRIVEKYATLIDELEGGATA